MSLKRNFDAGNLYLILLRRPQNIVNAGYKNDMTESRRSYAHKFPISELLCGWILILKIRVESSTRCAQHCMRRRVDSINIDGMRIRTPLRPAIGQ